MLADHKLGDGEMGMVQVVHNVQVHGPKGEVGGWRRKEWKNVVCKCYRNLKMTSVTTLLSQTCVGWNYILYSLHNNHHSMGRNDINNAGFLCCSFLVYGLNLRHSGFSM